MTDMHRGPVHKMPAWQLRVHLAIPHVQRDGRLKRVVTPAREIARWRKDELEASHHSLHEEMS